jgi:hypothetical protein
MKRYVAALLVVLGLIGVVGVLAIEAGYAKDEAKDEDDAGAKCSEATLHGTYLVAHNGVVIEETKTGQPEGPFAIAGYEVYDGDGTVVGVFSSNFNGGVTHNDRIRGTYTVKANCTGTNTFGEFQADLFIAPDGSMYTFVQTNPPEVVASGFELRGTAKRVGQ